MISFFKTNKSMLESIEKLMSMMNTQQSMIMDLEQRLSSIETKSNATSTPINDENSSRPKVYFGRIDDLIQSRIYPRKFYPINFYLSIYKDCSINGINERAVNFLCSANENLAITMSDKYVNIIFPWLLGASNELLYPFINFNLPDADELPEPYKSFKNKYAETTNLNKVLKGQ